MMIENEVEVKMMMRNEVGSEGGNDDEKWYGDESTVMMWDKMKVEVTVMKWNKMEVKVMKWNKIEIEVMKWNEMEMEIIKWNEMEVEMTK